MFATTLYCFGNGDGDGAALRLKNVRGIDFKDGWIAHGGGAHGIHVTGDGWVSSHTPRHVNTSVSISGTLIGSGKTSDKYPLLVESAPEAPKCVVKLNNSTMYEKASVSKNAEVIYNSTSENGCLRQTGGLLLSDEVEADSVVIKGEDGNRYRLTVDSEGQVKAQEVG